MICIVMESFEERSVTEHGLLICDKLCHYKIKLGVQGQHSRVQVPPLVFHAVKPCNTATFNSRLILYANMDLEMLNFYNICKHWHRLIYQENKVRILYKCKTKSYVYDSLFFNSMYGNSWHTSVLM